MKLSCLFLLSALAMLFSADLTKQKINADQQLTAIMNALPKALPDPTNSDWPKTLGRLINDLSQALSEKSTPPLQLFFSSANQSLLLSQQGSDKVLFISQSNNNIEKHICVIDDRAAALARTIWETLPQAIFKTSAGMISLPIQAEDFSDILVVDSPPVGTMAHPISIYENLFEDGDLRLVFDKSAFGRKALQVEKLVRTWIRPQGSDFTCSPETLITLRYGTLLYGFSYQLMLDSLRIKKNDPKAASATFTSEVLAYWKLLAEGCAGLHRSKRFLSDLKPNHLLYSALAIIHADTLEKAEESAAALVYWTIFRKNWGRVSLVKRILEFDLELMSTQLPEYLNQMETQVLKESELKKPGKYSYQALKGILESATQ